MSYTKALLEILNENDVVKSTTLKEAASRWDVAGSWTVPDGEPLEVCSLCGHSGLKECYEIVNKFTNKIISPVGSKCINKFEVTELTSKMKWHKFFSERRPDTPETKFGMKDLITKDDICFAFEKGWIDSNDCHFMIDTINKKSRIKYYSKGQIGYVKRILYFKIKPNIKINSK